MVDACPNMNADVLYT